MYGRILHRKGTLVQPGTLTHPRQHRPAPQECYPPAEKPHDPQFISTTPTPELPKERVEPWPWTSKSCVFCFAALAGSCPATPGKNLEYGEGS